MISDNRLDDLGAIACDLLESVLRLIPEELIQGSRVQFHGIVKIGGVDRHVLEREREREKIKTNLSSKEGGFERIDLEMIFYLLVFSQQFRDDKVERLLAAVLSDLLGELLVILRRRGRHDHHQGPCPLEEVLRLQAIPQIVEVFRFCKRTDRAQSQRSDGRVVTLSFFFSFFS